MQRGWERRHPFLQLAPDAIAQRVHPAFPRAGVVAADTNPVGSCHKRGRALSVSPPGLYDAIKSGWYEPLQSGLRNTNYRIQLQDPEAALVLRLYTADPSACRREAALANLLHERVPLPTFLYVDPDADPPFALTNWIAGLPFDALLRTTEATRLAAASFAAGAVLANIHAVPFTQAGFLTADLGIAEPFHTGGDGWAQYLEALLFRGRAGPRLGMGVRDRLWRLVQANAPRLDVLRGRTTLVHADYKPWNLLLRRDGPTYAVAGVLDWEFAFAGPPLLDVAIFLRYAEALPAEYAQGFEAGYRAGSGQLPSDWLALARLLDLLNLCSMLDHPHGGATLIYEVGKLIATAVTAWEAAGPEHPR